MTDAKSSRKPGSRRSAITCWHASTRASIRRRDSFPLRPGCSGSRSSAKPRSRRLNDRSTSSENRSICVVRLRQGRAALEDQLRPELSTSKRRCNAQQTQKSFSTIPGDRSGRKTPADRRTGRLVPPAGPGRFDPSLLLHASDLPDHGDHPGCGVIEFILQFGLVLAERADRSRLMTSGVTPPRPRCRRAWKTRGAIRPPTSIVFGPRFRSLTE